MSTETTHTDNTLQLTELWYPEPAPHNTTVIEGIELFLTIFIILSTISITLCTLLIIHHENHPTTPTSSITLQSVPR